MYLHMSFFVGHFQENGIQYLSHILLVIVLEFIEIKKPLIE